MMMKTTSSNVTVAVFAPDETMTKPDFNETDQYGIPKWRHMKPYGRPRNETIRRFDAVPNDEKLGEVKSRK